MQTTKPAVSTREIAGKLGKERWYDIEGVGPLPSVTTVLSMSGMKGPALINWAVSKAVEQAIDAAIIESSSIYFETFTTEQQNNMIKNRLKDAKRADRAALEAAGDIGTEVHRSIAAYLSGGVPSAGPGPFDSWLHWWSNKPRKSILVEQPIWNEFSGYAGTIDCVAEEADGSITLYDWKTSSGIYADHHLQAAAYLTATQEKALSLAVRVDRAVLVHIPKNGGAVREVALGDIGKDQKRTPDELFDAFLGLLEAWKVLH